MPTNEIDILDDTIASEAVPPHDTPTMPANTDTTTTIRTSPIVRTIGVEIECLTPERVYWEDEESDLDHDIAEARSDGSIDGDGYGIEIVTKPCAGIDAEDAITAVCETIAVHEATTNASTGLHVHVDAQELVPKTHIKFVRDLEEFNHARMGTRLQDVLYIEKNMLAGSSNNALDALHLTETLVPIEAHGRYGRGTLLGTYRDNRRVGLYTIPPEQYDEYQCFAVDSDALRNLTYRTHQAMRFLSAVDPILRSLVPSSRRHNNYCQPFEKMARHGGTQPATYRDLMSGLNDRYCGINLRALEKHGTIENRYHGGTVNAQKIIHWARLWEATVRFAIAGKNIANETDALAEVVNGKNRLEMLCALLEIPDDTTAYLLGRHTAFMGSDARHAISYINKKLIAQGKAPRATR